MANYRIPGRQCDWLSIDDGTRCRQRSPSAGYVGFHCLTGTGFESLGFISNYYRPTDKPTGKAGAGQNLPPSGDYNAGISIAGDAAWITKIRTDLDKIAQTSTGKGLLSDIASSGKKVKIVETKNPSATNTAPAQRNPDAIPKGKFWEDWKDSFGRPRVPEGTGKGSDSVVQFNPGQKLPDEEWFKGLPSAVMLAHELIHSDLYARGTYDPEVVDEVRNGERQVIGLRPFENGRFTENKIRSEWNPRLNPRLKH